MSFFEELKRRNVVRVGVVYLIAAWLLAQVADLMLENFNSPDWVIQAILVLLIIGFPVALIFAWAFELTPEGIKKEKDVDRAQSITHATGRKLDRTIIIILAVGIAFLLFDRFSSPQSEDNVIPDRAQRASGTQSEVIGTEEDRASGNAGATQGASDERGVDLPPAKSIAVLPFVNMSSDPEQEYFSDGISEEILNSLARVRELKVAGRTSSFAFKGQNQDLRKIGETLGVQHILEGSVRKSGNTVRITAQLVQVDDGFHLWSDTYDRQLDNVFAIQDEIATAILDQLKATLIGDELAEVAADRTNSEAYDLYLLAKQRIHERKETPLQSAVALLDEAITLDPGYAPAHAQRAIATMLLSEESYGTIPVEESQAQARLYIERALSLDPGLAEANAALGLYHLNRPGEDEQAVDTLEKALSINPNLVNASNWLASSLFNLGRVREALIVRERMLELDPFYRPGIHGAVNLYNNTGRSEESWALIDRISPFFPDDPMVSRLRGMTHLDEGHAGDALPPLEEAWEAEPSNLANRTHLAVSQMQTGQYERAADMDVPWIRSGALFLLDRSEEANLIAADLAATGEQVEALFYLMAAEGRYDELIEFFETRWQDFEAFEADFPPLGRGSILTYADIARAYGAVGNEGRFDEALARYRLHLDRLHELGFQGISLHWFEAVYFTMTGDHDRALDNLGQAVDAGFLSYPRMSRETVHFKPLEGDPEFEAIQARMVDHLNAERAKAGLGPIST
jgi:TolB-like protein/Tfp pilus assembly protein PilF